MSELSSLSCVVVWCGVCVGYESDSESFTSEVAEDIVVQVLGSDDEVGGAAERNMKGIPQPKEKENVRPGAKAKAPATRNQQAETGNGTANTEPAMKEVTQYLTTDSKGAKKGKSVRFSISPSPTPLPPKSVTPPPKSPPKSVSRSPPRAATLPTATRAGKVGGATTPKELLQCKQIVPNSNKVGIAPLLSDVP